MKIHPILDPDRSVLVERVDNGYAITYWEEYSDGTEGHIIHRRSYANPDDDWVDIGDGPNWGTVKKMLWDLLDSMGLYNSKYYKTRLKIEVEKQ